MANIFITGGTGYIGRRFIELMINRGHIVYALVRSKSVHKLPPGAKAVIANPFDPASFEKSVPPGSVFVQLLGVAHPSPRKASQFREIDLRSVKASADAAKVAGVSKFVYVSVAMTPSKYMHAYQEVRKEGEEYCKKLGLNCTFIRPWYVLGPGHWWPVLLYPVYGLAEVVPSWRQKARAIGLVSIKQMLRTLINAVEVSQSPLSIIEIKDIRHAKENKNI